MATEAGDDGGLNLKQVAQRLGVHYMTVYRYVRTGQLRAVRVGTVWVVDPHDLASFEQLRTETSSDATARPATVDWVARLTGRLVAGDDVAAWDLVEDALIAGWSAEDAIVGLIGPAVAAVQPSDGPAAGHLAATTAIRTSAVLSGRFRPRGRHRGTVVVGAPSGESHSLGLALLADLLRIRNLAVLELGGNCAPEVFADAAARADRLIAVAIGATDRARLWEAREAVLAVRARVPGSQILLGGPAVADADVAEMAGADAWEADLAGVGALIERMVLERTVRRTKR